MNRQQIIKKGQIIATRDGQNGFKEITRNESVGSPSTHSPEQSVGQRELAEEQSARKSVVIHSRSQFIIAECAQEWPKLSDLKLIAQQKWTIPNLKARIEKVKHQHRQEIVKALRYLAHEERQAIEDQYAAFDYADLRGPFSEEFKEISMRMQNERYIVRQDTDDFFSRLRYAHIKTLEHLYKTMKELQAEEGRSKLERARTFPMTPQGWRLMDTKDAKLKVAAFLLLDKKGQEEMLRREINWAKQKAHIDSLLRDFSNDIVFAQEVRNFVKESQTTDPRRRSTTN